MKETAQAVNPLAKLPLTELIVKLADDRKAIDVIQMDVRDLSILSDDVIIMSGNSAPHLRALSDRIERDVRDILGIRPRVTDGTPASGWVLMDYGIVMVHILTPEVRQRYDLEKLWADAPRVETLKKLQKMQDKIKADAEKKIAAAAARTSVMKKTPAKKATTAKTADKPIPAKKTAVKKVAVKVTESDDAAEKVKIPKKATLKKVTVKVEDKPVVVKKTTAKAVAAKKAPVKKTKTVKA